MRGRQTHADWRKESGQDSESTRFWVVTRDGRLLHGPSSRELALSFMEYDSVLFAGSSYLAGRMMEQLRSTVRNKKGA
jgi:hypothetical protein